jgi:hypothetical protein
MHACKTIDFAELGIQAPIREEEKEKKKNGKNKVRDPKI